ncbi:MAG: hypothetical protein ABIJ53_02965 [Verrucomicrobiota bacterium]
MPGQDNGWVVGAKDNASKIECEIDSIMPSDGEFLWHDSMSQQNFKDFWQGVKSINAMFKELKLIKEDRERLWGKLNTACERAKDKQQKTEESKNDKSQQWYDSIMSDVMSAECDPIIGNPDIETLKHCGQLLKKAGLALSEHKHDMTAGHKSEIFDQIKKIRENHDAYWEAVKGARSEKRRDFERKVRANLEKNYDRLRKAKYALEKAEDHARKLKDDISSAWSESAPCRWAWGP